MREGKTVRLTDILQRTPRKKQPLPVTIRIPREDIATARQLANSKGIGYQTCIKLLLHEVLTREARRTREIKK